MVDIMCDVNPEYRQHVVVHGGKKILYVRVIRSIYGCIKAALLWYELYKETLENEGFILNPYENCIANIKWSMVISAQLLGMLMTIR